MRLRNASVMMHVFGQDAKVEDPNAFCFLPFWACLQCRHALPQIPRGRTTAAHGGRVQSHDRRATQMTKQRDLNGRGQSRRIERGPAIGS